MPESALADAFAVFNATAGRLESSYLHLQGEVSRLRAELEERNAALDRSRRANESMQADLQHILDFLPCGVVVVNDRDQQVVLINPQARRMLGTSSAHRISTHDLPSSIGTVLGFVATGDDEHEFRIDTPNGKKWLAARRSVSRNEASRAGRSVTPGKTILILRDITSHKEAEAQREASRNLVALGEMAGILAHEVRNPLASIELLAELLAQHLTQEEEPKQWISYLRAGVRSLSATVNNVLQLHASGPAHTPIQISPWLENAIGFVRPLAEQAGVKINLRCPEANAEMVGDEAGLRQLILNLALNSFRHTAAGGMVSVSVRLRSNARGRFLILKFADTGKGIEPDHLSRIFEPGFSARGRTPGLGLAICRRIVEQHHGLIRVKSRIGHGTTFHIWLPLR